MSICKSVLVISVISACCGPAKAKALEPVRYVNQNAAGANNGTSWKNAFNSLQDALLGADPGQEIWVAQGTYTPGPPDDAISSFELKSGVALYGGFAGDEASRDERDWKAHPTILSGDVGNDDIYGAGVWYVSWNRQTANSGHVVLGSGTDPTAILDGFTVMAGATGPEGTPAGSHLMVGSGMYIVGGSPTIRNCTFLRNLAAFAPGGAIYNHDSSPTITNCTFKENYVHLGHGAGIFNGGMSAPTITDCQFLDNISVGSGTEAAGAAISNYFSLPISIDRCVFERNVATNNFGAFYPAYGGAIENLGAALTVRNCIFRANVANAGGAINTFGPLTVVSSLFIGNVAGSYHVSGDAGVDGIGGAVSSLDFGNSHTQLINCTIVANRANEAGGIISMNGHHTTLRNTIVWGNVATGEEVAPRDAQYKGSTAVLFSNVQDLLTPIPGEDAPNPADYPASMDEDPLFIDGIAENYRLLPESPSIDMGDPITQGAGQWDLDGLVRVPCGRVDMGAYESCTGDLNCDGAIDPDDVIVFAECLVGPDVAPPPTCARADIDASGVVDLRDYSHLQNRYLGQ